MSQHHKSTRSDRIAKAEFKAECREADLPCWLCGDPIDWDAAWDDWQNDDRYERDHVYAASTHPELYDEPSNWRPSHAGCNNAKSNTMAVGGLGPLSRQWVPAT